MMFIGRSIQETSQIFEFYDTVTPRHHGTFVDWGSGRGRMLRHAKQHGFADTVGFELHPALAAGTGALVRDIMDDPVANATVIPPASDGVLHYVYDGGLYPRVLSQAIVVSLGALPSPQHQAVLVVTSLCEPFDPSAQFSAADWRHELRGVGFKRRKETCTLRENKYSEDTMIATLYYK